MKSFKVNESARLSSGFSPDEQYFDSMQLSVMQKIAAEPKTLPLYRKLWFPAAAAIVILSMLLTVLLYDGPAEEITDLVSIENYLTYGTAITHYEISGELTDADIDMLESDLLLDDKTVENILIDNPNIEQYLLY